MDDSLDKVTMDNICSTPLKEFLENKKIEGYYDIALQWMDHLGVMQHPESTYSHLIPELVWELRQFLPESLALQHLIEPMIDHFRHVEVQKSDTDVAEQIELYLIFCRICSRKAYVDDSDSFQGALPAPHKEDDNWIKWDELLNASQKRIVDSQLPYGDYLLLPVAPGEPLDNMCYASFIRNQIDPKLPTHVQHELRQRIWDTGEVLRICSNVLGHSSELQPIHNLIRKAFLRVRYILDETAQRNWSTAHLFMENEEEDEVTEE